MGSGHDAAYYDGLKAGTVEDPEGSGPCSSTAIKARKRAVREGRLVRTPPDEVEKREAQPVTPLAHGVHRGPLVHGTAEVVPSPEEGGEVPAPEDGDLTRAGKARRRRWNEEAEKIARREKEAALAEANRRLAETDETIPADEVHAEAPPDDAPAVPEGT